MRRGMNIMHRGMKWGRTATLTDVATSKRTSGADNGKAAGAKRRRTTGQGYQPAETRDALRKSALKLFEERGYPTTSVEDIVSEAGLTKGAFYHHFSSKEELLQLIHDAYVDSILATLEAVVAQHSDPEDQVRELMRASILGLDEFRSHIIVYMQDRRFITGEWQNEVSAKRDAIDRLMQGAIERGVAGGQFRKDVSPRLISFGIIGMSAWIIQWWRPDGPLSLEEIAQQYIDFALGGLRKQPRARR
jgi:TetR/AcrR family transcriptional regulator, cholesterol catabolism regulator